MTYLGASPVVQWIRLGPPNAGNTGSSPGQGTRSHKPQVRPTTGKIKQTNNEKNQPCFLYCNQQLYFLMSWGSNFTGCPVHFHAGCLFPFIIFWKFYTACVCPSERFCLLLPGSPGILPTWDPISSSKNKPLQVSEDSIF